MARPDRSAALRDELERRLAVWRRADLGEPPVEGWVRGLRHALGLTTRELAERLGVTQSRVPALERAEVDRTLQLGTLERAAAALGCRLVYALVPDRPLHELVPARRVRLTDHDLVRLEAHLASLDRPLTPAEIHEVVRSLLRAQTTGARSPVGDHSAEAPPAGDQRVITSG